MTEPATPGRRRPARRAWRRPGYLADDGLATALFLAVRMGQPLLLEGEPGVGKTEAAKALAAALDTPLIRLQCYEGLTAAEALYEWNYPRQLLAIRLAEARGERARARPTCSPPTTCCPGRCWPRSTIPGPRPAVLLIDEVDRADDEFEAFLFELLAEGVGDDPGARHPPRHRAAGRVLTSNRTRDLHDALQAALPLPLDPLPVTRTGSPRSSAAGCRAPPSRSPTRIAGAVAAPARPRPAQAARRRRGDRLGRRAGGARACPPGTSRPPSAPSARCSSTTRTWPPPADGRPGRACSATELTGADG